jgi:hypothetical protein
MNCHLRNSLCNLAQCQHNQSTWQERSPRGEHHREDKT